jgi:hypothetical protein
MAEDQSMQAYSSSKVENIYCGVQFYIFQSTNQFALLKMPHRYVAVLKTLPPDLGNVFCLSMTIVNHT